MKASQLSLRFAVLFLTALLGLSTQATTQEPIKVEKGTREQVAEAKKLFDNLKAKPGYKALDTKLFRSEKALPMSLTVVRMHSVYASGLKIYLPVEELVRDGDVVTFNTLARSKAEWLPSLAHTNTERLDGWVAVHRYKAKEGDSLEEKTKVFLMDKHLGCVIDSLEWKDFKYEEVVNAIKGLDDYFARPIQKADEQFFGKVEQHELIDKLPQLPGGEKALYKYLVENVKYPLLAAENGIQGRVIIQFVVNEDGSVSNVVLAQSVHPLLDLEAMRVVLKMPKWNPAMKGGKPVRALFALPVVLRLEKAAEPLILRSDVY